MALSFLVFMGCMDVSLGWDASAFLESLDPALNSIDKAWKMFHGASKTTWPSLRIEILEPPIGTKRSPPGEHPRKYLQGLPELNGYIVMDAKISYVSVDGEEVSISSQGDWLSYLNFLENDGLEPNLRLRFLTPNKKQESLWQKGVQAVQAVSESLRTFGKSLISAEQVEVEALNKEVDFLKAQGFTNFNGKGLVFEELGYDKADWPEVVDNLVAAGVPDVWGKSLKTAAKAKRGSIKSLTTNNYKNGVRSMGYMQFQVLPDGEGGLDGFFAIYVLSAESKNESTGLDIEQAFKRFVELDAHKEWKKEVAQFMPEHVTQPKPSGEL
jgi:hypothetical protein